MLTRVINLILVSFGAASCLARVLHHLSIALSGYTSVQRAGILAHGDSARLFQSHFRERLLAHLMMINGLLVGHHGV